MTDKPTNLPDLLYDARAEMLNMYLLVGNCTADIFIAINLHELGAFPAGTAKEAIKSLTDLEARSARVREIIGQYLNR